MCKNSPVLVVGLGNPLRGDDGVGWYCVDMLMKMVRDPLVDFVKCRELLPELSADLSKVGLALFIDASVQSQREAVEETVVKRKEDFPPLETHRLDPAGLLSMSHALYGCSPEAVMLTVKGESFDYKEEISEAVRDAADKLVCRAKEIVECWQQRVSEQGQE